MDKLTKDFFKWVRKQECYFAGKDLDLPKFPNKCSQEWNMETGEFMSDVSHIMRKGSKRRNLHFGNVFPNCRYKHHLWFETLSPKLREEFLPIGEAYYNDYLYENLCQVSDS